jgi:Saxitoxin biosynthesis operon protein SxtJ
VSSYESKKSVVPRRERVDKPRPSGGALHESFARDEEIQTSSDRAFGFVFAAVFAIVGCWPLLDGRLPRWWTLAISAAFLAVALVRPVTLAPLNRLWTRFGLLLHRVVNPIVLGVIFFGVITPIGLVMRAIGWDGLRLKRDSAADTYWIERRPPGPPPAGMKDQF